MKVALVILNFNGKHLLEKFLPSVITHSANEATIYVIDNGSTDKSLSFLHQTYSDQITVIKLDKNYGFAGGYNKGLAHINEELIGLLNSDIEVTSQWLNPVTSAFSENKELAIVQPKILNQINKSHFDYAGAAGGFIDKYGYPFCRGRIFDTIERDVQQYDDKISVFWASGACLFIRNSVFKSLGGFDQDFFAHMEEIDLCWRAFNTGFKTMYIPESVVYHVGGATLSYGHSRKTYLNFRNSLFMLVKNVPQSQIVPTLFVRMLLDGLAALFFLIQFKPNHFFAVLKAHGSFYRRLKPTLQKRSTHKKRKNYFKKTSIVWHYYMRQKKEFSSL